MTGEIMRLWAGNGRGSWRKVPILRVTAKRVYIPWNWELDSEAWVLTGKLRQMVLDRAKLERTGRFNHRKTGCSFLTDAGRAVEDARWAAVEAERARYEAERARLREYYAALEEAERAPLKEGAA